MLTWLKALLDGALDPWSCFGMQEFVIEFFGMGDLKVWK